MLIMVIQVNPTIDKVLYYLVLKVQASAEGLGTRGWGASKTQVKVLQRQGFLFFKSKKMNG
jgi:hypothetical protein